MGDIVLQEGDNVLNVVMTRIVANLDGVVTDNDTGLPLQGVQVDIDGLTTLTDALGGYSFSGLAPGPYVVTFTLAGYQTETR